jgi:hypothetical protein
MPLSNAQLAAILSLVRAAEREDWWDWSAQQAEDWFSERLRKRGFDEALIEPLALKCMEAMAGV